LGPPRPTRACNGLHSGIQILLDLRVEKGMAIRNEPHPRFYTDRTDNVPIAVPAVSPKLVADDVLYCF